MLCLNDTDVLEAWSDTDAKVDYSIHGLVGTTFTNLATGTLNDTPNTVVYTAGAAISVVSATFVNTDSSAVTVNFKLDPADGGNDKFLLPVAVSLAAGSSLVYDGQRFSVMDTSGQVLNTFPLPLVIPSGGTGLTSYTTGDLIYASGAMTLSKLADVTVGQVLISGGVGVAPGWSESPWVSETFGIGTSTVPHSGVGNAKFAIDGPDSSANGPHMQFTTDVDDYPLFGIKAWTHDAIVWYFDSYPAGGDDKSSDVGSNFSLGKFSDGLYFLYASGIAQGDILTWNVGLILDTSGIVSLPAVYDHDMNGETIHDLQINNSGELGYDSSTRRVKTKITDMEDTSWLYNLRPVNYYPKANLKMKRWGLIAEEVEEINSAFCFYGKDGQIEGIHKTEFIFPILNEVQKLRKDLSLALQRIEELENG